MSRNRIEDFGPYQDALRLFDNVVEDMELLQKDPRCYRLIGQQMGSADSICANMEEGFGRLSRTEFIRFLDISRGSARETLGRYKRFKPWLATGVIAARVDLADRIIARLTKAINTLRANNVPSVGKEHSRSAVPDSQPVSLDDQSAPGVRESMTTYDTLAVMGPDAITDNEIEALLIQ